MHLFSVLVFADIGNDVIAAEAGSYGGYDDDDDTCFDDEWLHHCHQFIRLSLPLLVLRVVLLLLLRSRVISSFLHLCVVLCWAFESGSSTTSRWRSTPGRPWQKGSRSPVTSS